ncbi:MAG: ATP-binding protein [Ignavibacteriaceae bacterium]|nr:ATP-binding protein [Ignavibacteriaceae bacterium]
MNRFLSRKEAFNLIEEGESLRCEFKRKFSEHEKIAKEIIAFANTKGGFLFIGIDDDKTVYGVQSEKSELDLILETVQNYCEPPIPVEWMFLNVDQKEVVIIKIPESKVKPHRIQDYKESIDLNDASVYIRVNDKSILASKQMIRLLKNSSEGKELIKYSIGELEKAVFKFLEKSETINVEQLCNSANISHRRASRTLVKMVRAGLLYIHNKDNGEEFFTHAG